MSAAVKLADDAIWWSGGLFLERLLDLVRSRYEREREAMECVERMSVIDYVSIDSDDELETRIARMIYSVAKDVVDGKAVLRPILSEKNVDLLVPSLRDLVAMFERDGRYSRPVER